MPQNHLYQYRWLAVIVSLYPSWAVENFLGWLGTSLMWSSEGRLPITFLSIGANMTSSFTFMSLPKSGCCSCVSTDHLSDACPLSSHKSWDTPTRLPVDKLTCIQEALCWWANRKSATLHELQSWPAPYNLLVKLLPLATPSYSALPI